MNLGKVLGVVVATQKESSLKSSSLYVLEPQDENQKPTGDLLIAADTVGSRPGDQVIWVSSREAALAMPETFTPVDAAIIGIVDSVHCHPSEHAGHPEHSRHPERSEGSP